MWPFSAVTILIDWFSLFYYMRALRGTSFFIRMVVEMIKEIKYFLLIFYVAIIMFANPIHLIDKPENMQATGGSYVMSIWYTYLAVLGEFGWSNDINTYFAHSPYSEFLWALFFFTVFFGQIVLLNLLIAIMGDVYDRVIEIS